MYLLFAGDQYYPGGGADDLVLQTTSRARAYSYIRTKKRKGMPQRFWWVKEKGSVDWWHIYDTKQHAISSKSDHYEKKTDILVKRSLLRNIWIVDMAAWSPARDKAIERVRRVPRHKTR